MFPGNGFKQWRFFSFLRSGPLITATCAELNSTQLNSTQLNYSAISSQSPLQSSTELDCPNFLHNPSVRTTLKTPVFYCCVHVRSCGNVFTEPLLRNGNLFICLLQSNSCPTCLFRGVCLAMGLYATVWNLTAVLAHGYHMYQQEEYRVYFIMPSCAVCEVCGRK
jgi:hypothetical protein